MRRAVGRVAGFRHAKQSAAMGLLSLLVLGSGTALGGAANQKLERVQEQIGIVESDLGKLELRSEKEQQRLRATEVEIGRLSRSLRTLKSKLRDRRSRLKELEAQRNRYADEMESQKRSLEELLRTAYMTGRQAYLKMLLSQQDPQKVGRVLTYFDYFQRARAERIHEIRERLKEFERLAEAISQERSAIAQLVDERMREKEALEKSKRKRERILALLRQEMGKGRAELERLRASEAKLKALLARLKRQGGEKPLFSPPMNCRGKKGFAWPVNGTIKAAFGTPRTRELRWKGVLIDAPEGEPVKAVSAGNVVFADWLRGYGLLVIIDHGGGYMSLYGHNQSLQKEAGTHVQAGEVISTVGNSGGNVHSGLYFEIRHNGQPVDPARWCMAQK